MNTIEQTKKLLGNIEWNSLNDCPVCRWPKMHGHSPACELRQAMVNLESCKAEQLPAVEKEHPQLKTYTFFEDAGKFVGFEEHKKVVDAQQQEIERLKTEKKLYFNIACERAMKIEFLTKSIDRLTIENKAHAEEITRLSNELKSALRDNNRLKNDIEQLTADLLKYGDHTSECHHRMLVAMRSEDESGCICGWDTLKAKLETKGK